MKNPAEAEDLLQPGYVPLPDPMPAGPLVHANRSHDPVLTSDRPQNTGLDLFLGVVKWIFLYLPGSAAIHFVMMGFALLYFYGDWSRELVGASLGILIFAAFMTMLGIGKLSDLRYLRVAASLFAAGGLAAILYSVLIVFFPGDFFGSYTRFTLPLTV